LSPACKERQNASWAAQLRNQQRPGGDTGG